MASARKTTRMMKPSELNVAMAAMLPTWFRCACSGEMVLVGLLEVLLLLEVLDELVLEEDVVVSEVVSEEPEELVSEVVSAEVSDAVVSSAVVSAVVSSAVVSSAVSVLSSAVAASAVLESSESSSPVSVSSARLITHDGFVGSVLTVVVAGTWAGAVRGG